MSMYRLIISLSTENINKMTDWLSVLLVQELKIDWLTQLIFLKNDWVTGPVFEGPMYTPNGHFKLSFLVFLVFEWTNASRACVFCPVKPVLLDRFSNSLCRFGVELNDLSNTNNTLCSQDHPASNDGIWNFRKEYTPYPKAIGRYSFLDGLNMLSVQKVNSSLTATVYSKILLLLGSLPNMSSEKLSAHTVLGWGLVDSKHLKLLLTYLYS